MQQGHDDPSMLLAGDDRLFLNPVHDDPDPSKTAGIVAIRRTIR